MLGQCCCSAARHAHFRTFENICGSSVHCHKQRWKQRKHCMHMTVLEGVCVMLASLDRLQLLCCCVFCFLPVGAIDGGDGCLSALGQRRS